MLSISGSVTLWDILNFVNNVPFTLMMFLLQQETSALITVFVLLYFLLASKVYSYLATLFFLLS